MATANRIEGIGGGSGRGAGGAGGRGIKKVINKAKAAKSDKAVKAMLNRKSEVKNMDRSVKVIYNGNTLPRESKEYKAEYNRLSDKAVRDAKSGKAAKQGAAQVEKYNAESGRNSTFRKKVSENVTVKIKKKAAQAEKDITDLRKTFGMKTTNSPAKTKANDRGLKAAQGPSLAKGKKKLEATKGSVERAKTKMQAQDNMILGSSKKEAYAKAAKTISKTSKKK